MSVNLLNDLPQINQRRLFSKRHLQAHAIRFFENGFDCRLYDPSPSELNRYVIADLIIAHVLLA
jgi:hypothetical protein